MDTEKPKARAWHERSDRPIAVRPMNKEQVEEFRKYLVMSYKCDDTDIIFEFEKIFDENDEDRDDCLRLNYKMNTIWFGKPTMRSIYTIKLPIPLELRMMAEQLRRNGKVPQRRRGGRAARPALQIEGAPSSVVIEEVLDKIAPMTGSESIPVEVAAGQTVCVPIVQEPAAPRPAVRKPVRKPRAPAK